MIVAAGEALIDLVEDTQGRYQPCLGGSVFNYALAMGMQGVATAYLNPLSDDSFGERLGQRLLGANVVLAYPARSALPTALALVNIGADGGAHYAFHLQGVADSDTTAEALVDALPGRALILHTGGLSLLPRHRDLYLPLMREARERGLLISIDANLRPVAAGLYLQAYRANVREALGLADLVKVSEEDLAHLGLEGDPLSVAMQLRADIGAQLLCLTCGAQGAHLVAQGCVLEQTTPAGLTVADTVGAGDCFYAGFLAYLHRLAPDAAGEFGTLPPALLGKALRHAVAAASLNVERVGCEPPTWWQTEETAAALGNSGAVATSTVFG